MRKILFMHIPKTAGMSVLLYLRQVYAMKNRLELRRQDNSLQSVDAARVKQADFIWLHTPLKLLKYDVNAYFKFSFLRDPVQRIRSTYFYLRDPAIMSKQNFDYTPESVVKNLRAIEKMSFRDFITSDEPVHKGHVMNVYGTFFRKAVDSSKSSPDDDDLQTYFDCMENDFDYIGLTPTLSQDMELLRNVCFAEYDEPFGDRRANVSKKKDVDIDMDDSLMEILREKISVDISIYEHACKLRDRRYEEWTNRLA